MDQQRLDMMLNQMEQNCDPVIGSSASIQFMLDCMQLIETELPEFAAEALHAIERSLIERTARQQWDSLWRECWAFVDAQQREGAGNSGVPALRALICVLDALRNPEQHDIVDHLSFFIGLVNRVKPHFAQEELLLRKRFDNCLSET